MIVSQLMSARVQVCRPSDSLNDAAERMWNADIGCLPVIDDAGHVVGMVTDRDICMAAYTKGKPLQAISVASVMSHGVCSCLPTDTPEQVEQLMRAHRVRRIPVINERGKLVGLISLNDLARQAAREIPSVPTGVPAGGLIATLATLCEPRRSHLVEMPAAPLLHQLEA